VGFDRKGIARTLTRSTLVSDLPDHMNRSVKSLLALVILIGLGASIAGFFGYGLTGAPLWVWASAIVVVVTTAALLRAEFRRDLYPDLLRQHAKQYFEQGGLCFAIAPWVLDGHFAWHILFQNRYERPCESVIHFRPTKFLPFGSPGPAEVRATVHCEGGAFGRMFVPAALPTELQGKTQRFELAARTNYLQGKGRMVRFRDGMAVGKSQLNILDTTVSVLSILALHPHFRRPATIKVLLPTGVAPDSLGDPQQEILWHPQDAPLAGKIA